MHSPYTTPHRDLLISALGPLQVHLGTALIRRFEFERVRALLLYLAVEGICHERSWLAYMFWPDSSLKTGLQNLRQTLAALKRALQPQEGQESLCQEPLLITTPTTIGLNPNAVYALDSEHFATLIATNEKHNHRRLESCRACMERLEQAVALYRGDFAQGVTVDSEPFEAWMLRKQEQFHSQVTRALATLSEYYVRQRQYSKGIHAARALLALDPLSDVGHHNLVHALAGDNQRHSALKQCHSYEKLLRTELGLTLPTRTAQLQVYLVSEDWEPWMVVHSPIHNLPGTLNPTIGYEKEMTAIHDRLASGKDRLLTLSGISGVGKTRLAIETAWQELSNFRDGVFFISLENIKASGVLAAIAASLTPMDLGSATNQRLSRYLRDKEILLILDGFDHLIQSDASVLRWLLLDAPHLQLLVTSRERLRLQGESCIAITGLDCPCPSPTRPLETYDAVRFFIECTRGWQPNFTLDNHDDRKVIIELCQNVGGNPRALDLYAQVARFFPLAQIVGKFEQVTQWSEALNRDLLERRHRSLKSMFYASWGTLSKEERRALTLLAIFPDSFTLTAAQTISKVESSTILSLFAKSCLCAANPEAALQNVENQASASVTRFYLPKLLRVYLWQTLERVPALMKQVARSHAMYFMSTLNQNVTVLPTASKQSQAVVLKTIQAEKANLDQAMVWAVQDGSTAVRAQIEQDLTAVYIHESRLWNPNTLEHTNNYSY